MSLHLDHVAQAQMSDTYINVYKNIAPIYLSIYIRRSIMSLHSSHTPWQGVAVVEEVEEP